MLLKLHDFDVHGEVGTGCRLWGLQPCQLWKDSSEGAEETEEGGGTIGRLCGERRNERGQAVGSVSDTIIVILLS